jgi:hypothetical protein
MTNVHSTREVKLTLHDNQVTTETLDNIINELRATVKEDGIYDICIKLNEWNFTKREWQEYKARNTLTHTIISSVISGEPEEKEGEK